MGSIDLKIIAEGLVSIIRGVGIIKAHLDTTFVFQTARDIHQVLQFGLIIIDALIVENRVTQPIIVTLNKMPVEEVSKDFKDELHFTYNTN